MQVGYDDECVVGEFLEVPVDSHMKLPLPGVQLIEHDLQFLKIVYVIRFIFVGELGAILKTFGEVFYRNEKNSEGYRRSFS